MVYRTEMAGNFSKSVRPCPNLGASMNRCEKWAFCPLGDLAKHVGCRKPHCPKGTIANSPSVLGKDVVIPVKPKKR